jgi:hypothetical protein
MKNFLYLCVFIALFSNAIFADVRVDTPTPKPKAGKSIDTLLRVDIKRDAKEARLLIPKNQLKQLRAELEEFDDSSDSTASLSFTKTQTIISGLFMTLAFIFGGVWLSRSRKIDTRASKILVIGSVLFLSGAVGTIAFANAGPPPEARVLTNKFFSNGVNIYKFGSGKIKLETSTEVDIPTLIVPDIPEEKKPTGEE